MTKRETEAARMPDLGTRQRQANHVENAAWNLREQINAVEAILDDSDRLATDAQAQQAEALRAIANTFISLCEFISRVAEVWVRRVG